MARCTLRSALAMAGWIATASMALTGSAISAALYRCHVKDAVAIQDDGTLGRNGTTEIWRKALDDFIVDTSTGVIRFSLYMEKWEIVQKGSGVDDFVAVPSLAPASAATDFIRIRAWGGKKSVLFIKFGLSQMFSGTCESIP